MYTHSAKLLQCDQCDKQFPFESQLTSHKISHEEEGQFPCDQCPKRMKNKSDFKKHLSAHTDETYECQYCDEYVASDIRNLKGHLKTHDKLLSTHSQLVDGRAEPAILAVFGEARWFEL